MLYSYLLGIMFTIGILFSDWEKGKWTKDDYVMVPLAMMFWPLYLGILTEKLIARVR